MTKRVLIVDDDKAMRSWLEADLRQRGFATSARDSGAAAIALITEQEFDVVLTDLRMTGMSGVELCRRVAEARPDTPVVVLTAFGSLDSAIAAIRAGAYDFITKPVEIETLAIALERAIQNRSLREEVKRLRRAVADSNRFEGTIGGSAAMKRVYDLLDRIRDSDASVLITGESGTGKEVAARALHTRGRRAAGPFVAINCAAVPEALLESELFGHVRGAFTDARSARTGLFVQATGGVLFLDEIAELPRAMQPKLLRALQERVVRPVGSDSEIPFDARIVAASNRDLEDAIEAGEFREDLYFRINVIHLVMPPLRARGSDVLLLAQRFIENFAVRADKAVNGISSAAAEKLLAYSWPGNIRELHNCIERAVALTGYEQLTVDDLPEKVKSYRPLAATVLVGDATELVRLDEMERRYVLKVVEIAGGNKTEAARILGLDRKTLRRKLERWLASNEAEVEVPEGDLGRR